MITYLDRPAHPGTGFVGDLGLGVGELNWSCRLHGGLCDIRDPQRLAGDVFGPRKVLIRIVVLVSLHRPDRP
jgi:hypothetical protein